MYPAKVNSYQCPGCWGDCGRETKVMRSILDRKHCQKELSLNPYKATHWQLSRLESQVCWDDVGWGMYTADTVYPSPSSFVHACIQSHPSVALQGRGWLQRINKQRLVKQIIISSLIPQDYWPKGFNWYSESLSSTTHSRFSLLLPDISVDRLLGWWGDKGLHFWVVWVHSLPFLY